MKALKLSDPKEDGHFGDSVAKNIIIAAVSGFLVFIACFMIARASYAATENEAIMPPVQDIPDEVSQPENGEIESFDIYKSDTPDPDDLEGSYREQDYEMRIPPQIFDTIPEDYEIQPFETTDIATQVFEV